jgi:SPP1 family predicted phage head-tail adaptor
MARYRPGELDQRIKIMQKQNTPDGMGGNVFAWVETSEVWAMVKSVSGSEVVDYQQVNAEARYLFVVRNGLSVTDSNAIEWEGEFYNIRVRKQPKKRSMYLEIEGVRGVAQ